MNSKDIVKNIVTNYVGMPLVLYHGTNDIFSEFKDYSRGKTNATGVFFTDKYSVAKTYGEHVHAVYLVLNNTVTVDFRGRNWNNGPCEYEIYDYDGYFVNNFETAEEAEIYKKDSETVIVRPLMINSFGDLEPDYSADESCCGGFSTDEFSSYARSIGFSCILMKNVIDYGKFYYKNKNIREPSDIYCVTDPNLIINIDYFCEKSLAG